MENVIRGCVLRKLSIVEIRDKVLELGGGGGAYRALAERLLETMSNNEELQRMVRDLERYEVMAKRIMDDREWIEWGNADSTLLEQCFMERSRWTGVIVDVLIMHLVRRGLSFLGISRITRIVIVFWGFKFFGDMMDGVRMRYVRGMVERKKESLLKEEMVAFVNLSEEGKLQRLRLGIVGMNRRMFDLKVLVTVGVAVGGRLAVQGRDPWTNNFGRRYKALNERVLRLINTSGIENADVGLIMLLTQNLKQACWIWNVKEQIFMRGLAWAWLAIVGESLKESGIGVRVLESIVTEWIPGVVIAVYFGVILMCLYG